MSRLLINGAEVLYRHIERGDAAPEAPEKARVAALAARGSGRI
jgi:hypothetical protein